MSFAYFVALRIHTLV